ncbi:MAG: hypothetical protein WA459_05965 [Stellaceae bacterium]
MSSRSSSEAIQQGPFMATVSRTAANRRIRRAREKRTKPELTPFVAPRPIVPNAIAPDPVPIAVLAIERLGRASMRAALCGIEVRVAVPDEATAAIFRAALAETGRTRVTDRLVRVVVD